MALIPPTSASSFFLITKDDTVKDTQERPYLLLAEKPPVATVENLTHSSIKENTVRALNGESFLKILNSPVDSNIDVKSSLFIVPVSAVKEYVEHMLPEQTLFLALFHHLHFLAALSKPVADVAALDASFAERFTGLSALLKKEFASQTIFGVPSKDLQTYFTALQTKLVGSDSRRHKSLMDLIETIQQGPTQILTYFSEAQRLKASSDNNAGSAYSGAETRRGFNSYSLGTFTTENNDNNTASTTTIPNVEEQTASSSESGSRAPPASVMGGPALSLATSTKEETSSEEVKEDEGKEEAKSAEGAEEVKEDEGKEEAKSAEGAEEVKEDEGKEEAKSAEGAEEVKEDEGKEEAKSAEGAEEVKEDEGKEEAKSAEGAEESASSAIVPIRKPENVSPYVNTGAGTGLFLPPVGTSRPIALSPYGNTMAEGEEESAIVPQPRAALPPSPPEQEAPRNRTRNGRKSKRVSWKKNRPVTKVEYNETKPVDNYRGRSVVQLKNLPGAPFRKNVRNTRRKKRNTASYNSNVTVAAPSRRNRKARK